MKLAVALLTYNRKALFEKTLKSLGDSARAGFYHQEFDMLVVDNGSTDGTAELVSNHTWYFNSDGWMTQSINNTDGNHTVGHGMNIAINGAIEMFHPDIVLFTADDYEYKPDWYNRLMKFWDAAPHNIALACCNIEPDYPWATVMGRVEYGGERALIRRTIPGSNWSFRAHHWGNTFGPIRETTGGEDLEVLMKLAGQDYQFAALDLAEHIGERQSAWGNQSWRYAVTLDLKKWGMA